MALQVVESTNSQNQLVENVYRKKNLIATYAAARLFPAEAVAFIRYRDDLIDRSVLDLGCGAGRLAVYLEPIVSHYAGFDISPYMVEYCRRRYAGDFFEGDMRDLSVFGDGAFDTVLAVSNLFDAVSHEDRYRVFAEVRRVLVEGGLLFFSAHNRNYSDLGYGPSLQWSRNPLTLLRHLTDFGKAMANHNRLKAKQRSEDDYALINDSGNNFASLHYYVRREVQLRQLIDLGFEPLECFDSLGCTLASDSDDSHCPSIHYVARR